MFHQLLTPIGHSLTFSVLVAALPVLVVVVMLGVLRTAAWLASLAGLAVGFAVAVGPWHMPPHLAFQSALNGATFALWPVMWLVLNGLLLYNIAVRSGRFDAFRSWLLANLPGDRRVVLVVVGFCFGALLEGVIGFGCPVAITSSLLIAVGFEPLPALVFVLIFNTAPVAFGALGTPVTVLAAVTGLPAATLAAMIGRQLPVIALILPLYVTALYGGWRSVRSLAPLLLVAGGSFALVQCLAANLGAYTLVDVLSSLISLTVTLLFLRRWRPAPDATFAVQGPPQESGGSPPAQAGGTPVQAGSPPAQASGTPVQGTAVSAWQGWLPWAVAVLVVVPWTWLNVAAWGERRIPWPQLHDAIAITLYHDRPYAAVWSFQPLGSGTAILVACVICALLLKVTVRDFAACMLLTLRQIWLAVVTVMLIVALAYLMNYSGLAYTLGLGAASAGRWFVLFSPLLGWVAVALSGSDTSGNALFGNLQVVAARQLDLSPVLFAATNSSGGVMSKMISPQNIATGVSVIGLRGREGAVFARTFLHSLALTLVLVALVIVQQFLLPGTIPGAGR